MKQIKFSQTEVPYIKKIKCVELNNNNRKCIRGGLHKRRQN